MIYLHVYATASEMRQLVGLGKGSVLWESLEMMMLAVAITPLDIGSKLLYPPSLASIDLKSSSHPEPRFFTVKSITVTNVEPSAAYEL